MNTSRNSLAAVILCIAASAGCLFADGTRSIIGTPRGTSYFMFEQFGGTWSDVEKSPLTVEDNNLCWAAAASNALQWTGWGQLSGMASADEYFAYYRDHWTNVGGSQDCAWQWWFSGVNTQAGQEGWSQVDVPGGSFAPSVNFDQYYIHAEFSVAISATDRFLRQGYGTTLYLGNINGGGHAVTVWGDAFDPQTGDILGLWITDSDDDKANADPPDTLRYYDVEYNYATWQMVNYYGTNDWHVLDVLALKSVPEPASLLVLAIGGAAILRRRKAV